MNTTTRKYARTLQEAFGPYAEWHPERDDPDKWVIRVALIICGIVLGLGLGGGL